ncbi:MAG TPA: S8 family serine peptidase [Actinomycetes bacterium]|nr:S8 family serine peptidase [Actinomycetes bacterium]
MSTTAGDDTVRLPDLVDAQVSPRSVGGVSMLDASTITRDSAAAFSGTSAAAPQVAGVCALIRQMNAALPPAAVRDLLGRTAQA